MRDTGTYLSGMTFSLGWWFFIDSVLYSNIVNTEKIHISLVDWIPCILSTVGMLMINSIDKDRLISNSFTYTRYNVVWKARLLLFLGFSLLASGVAGSFTVLIIKYLLHNYPYQIFCLGIENAIANSLIALSTIILWAAINHENSQYHYNLTLN
ncbi:hypothetical protein PNEG_01157 [Pneumocystis murina B123]|uniref:Vacuolar protein sorting-associated protein 68 n=1 Tax=Pneumocystis murina (strain B123) TaxID=1069680 RepID=M7NP11_PNEMU|nr:hypothetical protein PNEG_01157 [Pneumocystis murina B123]EMR10443.1 hypothetical protein PNEG_01157 [Pneumocystis murina B123]